METTNATKDQLEQLFNVKYSEMMKYEKLLKDISYASLGEKGEMREVWSDMRTQTLEKISVIENELRDIAKQHKRLQQMTSV